MCQLTGQEVANASMYDGSTALTEAVLMAERLTSRRHVLVARSVHPEYRQVLKTYAKNLGLEIEEIGCTESGQLDRAALKPEILAVAAAVVVQSPNFFGVLEDARASRNRACPRLAAHPRRSPKPSRSASSALRPKQTSSPWRAKPLASLPVQGPIVGVIATRDKYVRQMPGRLAGQTADADGNRGFVLTLATREQHIRREKATSNICTNEALYALAATIHLCLHRQRRPARTTCKICPKRVSPRPN